MTVQKHFFENYRGGHDVWADMTAENTVYIGNYIFYCLFFIYSFYIDLKIICYLILIIQKLFDFLLK